MAEHLEAPKSTEGMTYIYKYFINLIKVIYWITFKDPQTWALLQYILDKIFRMETRVI